VIAGLSKRLAEKNFSLSSPRRDTRNQRLAKLLSELKAVVQVTRSDNPVCANTDHDKATILVTSRSDQIFSGVNVKRLTNSTFKEKMIFSDHGSPFRQNI
jgi:hypothetical protein